MAVLRWIHAANAPQLDTIVIKPRMDEWAGFKTSEERICEWEYNIQKNNCPSSKFLEFVRESPAVCRRILAGRLFKARVWTATDGRRGCGWRREV
jgi:hypothetical protein